MALWSCPHCGAAQPASSRCWVCRRSSTTCSTCRHFRTSLSVDVGWCALDRRRRPLTGLELRGCWSERPAAAGVDAQVTPRPATEADLAWRVLHARTFVPVESLMPPAARTRDPGSAPNLDVPLTAVEPADAWDGRVSLFGDLER